MHMKVELALQAPRILLSAVRLCMTLSTRQHRGTGSSSNSIPRGVYLNYSGAGSGARTQKITVFNADTKTVSFKISHQPALAERWSSVQSQQVRNCLPSAGCARVAVIHTCQHNVARVVALSCAYLRPLNGGNA